MDLTKYPVQWIELSRIDENDRKHCFRRKLNTEKIKPSLKERGQDFAIVLRSGALANGKRQIICGFTRFAAVQELGWEKILAVVIPIEDLNDEAALDLCFRENVQREGYTDFDLIDTCKRLKDMGKSYSEIADKIGKSKSMVMNYIKIAESPEIIKNAVLEGKMPIRKFISTFCTKKIVQRCTIVDNSAQNNERSEDLAKNDVSREALRESCNGSPNEIRDTNNEIHNMEQQRDAAKDAYIKGMAEYRKQVEMMGPSKEALDSAKKAGDLIGLNPFEVFEKMKEVFKDKAGSHPQNTAEIPGSVINITKWDEEYIEVKIPIRISSNDKIDKLVLYLK